MRDCIILAMKNFILTPTQLWQDYDPARMPLRTSFVKYEKRDGFFDFGAYFDAEKADDGTVRIFAEGELRPEADKTVIFVGEPWDPTVPKPFVTLVDELGAGLVVADYSAIGFGTSGSSSYPSSLAWGKYGEGNAHFDKADPSAEGSCQYLWSKVLRRTVTFVKSVLPNTEIVLVGAGIGADMVWQCAATDERVAGLVSICNAGWREYEGIFRFDDNRREPEATDERERWLMGCAAQSYAKFVKCPCLYVSGSNNTMTSVDRVEATLSFVRNDRVYKTYYPNCNTILPLSWLTTLSAFIRGIGTDGEAYASPEVTLEQRDGYIGANIDFPSHSPEIKLTLYYAYNEYDSALRNWHPMDVGNGTARCIIPVADYAESVFCYVTAEYPDGVALSSYVAYLRTDAETIKEPVRKSHIVYERKTGLGEFAADSPSEYLTGEKPFLKEGAFGIAGISCGNADLTTYAVGEDKYFRSDSSLLQFDACSDNDRDFAVRVISKENGETRSYGAVCRLKGGEWTKCSLSPSMFKTEELKPLRDWNGIKGLIFEKMNGCVVKNILWV